MKEVRILLADDHPAMRAKVVQLLRAKFNVVGSFGDGKSLLDAAIKLEPDVVVLDISMPILSGIEAAQKLREAGSKAKIVFLTVYEDSETARQAIKAGAAAYVVKSSISSDLLIAVREAVAGRIFVSALNSI